MMIKNNIIKVDMGDFHTGNAPIILATFDVGSCVVVCLYDKKNKIGGMAHVMLPREYTKENIETLEEDGVMDKNSHEEAKYVDVGVDWMVEELETKGAKSGHLEAKIIGGAQMFPGVYKKEKSLGFRNVDAVKMKLSEWEIPIVFEEVGGNKGRSVTFFLEDGKVRIESMHGEIYG